MEKKEKNFAALRLSSGALFEVSAASTGMNTAHQYFFRVRGGARRQASHACAGRALLLSTAHEGVVTSVKLWRHERGFAKSFLVRRARTHSKIISRFNSPARPLIEEVMLFS